jgi:Domain of unknown function (DUF2382)
MKRPVIVEEVIVGKRKIQETKQVQDTIKKEEARIERSVPSVMEAGKSLTHFTNVGQEKDMAESPDILIVEGNPDMENIMAEVDKDEPRAKRTGSLNVTGEKNKPDLSASKKAETSGTQTDSPALKKNESKGSVDTPLAAAKSPVETPLAAVKEEAMQRNENSSNEKENKNNKNQVKKNQK